MDAADISPPMVAGTPTKAQLVLFGGGGHSLVVAEAAARHGLRFVGFFDDSPSAPAARKLGLPHLGTLAAASSWNGALWILALGNLPLRRSLIDRLGSRGAASVSYDGFTGGVCASATLGRGVYIGPHAVVHSDARVADHAIINSGAIVEHECVIAENVHVAPGAVLGGNCHVAPDTLIGLGARVLPGVRIGSGCTIAAGSVVLHDVPDNSTAIGVPAQLSPRARPLTGSRL